MLVIWRKPRAWIEAHDRWLEWSGAVLWQPHQHLLQARFHLLAGNLDDARRSAETALAQASEPRQPLILIAIHRLLGELAILESRVEEADAHLQQSLVLAEACVAPYEQAQTLLALAELRLAAGKVDQVAALVEEVRAICLPLGAAPVLRRVDRLVTELGKQNTSQQSFPDGLTPREVEILGLIAAGRSNREMAADLFLSVRTVERHITNIYGKVGARSRAEATAYAFRNDLTEE